MSDTTGRSGVDEILTLDEVAKILKIPIGTLRKWRSNSEGPKGFRVGKYVRYRRSAVEQFVSEQESKEDDL
jgi:excisionase family DNA binding protein